MTLRALLSFVSAHKIVCVCAAVGLLGGVLGFFAGLTAGLFAELIVRRVRRKIRPAYRRRSVCRPCAPRCFLLRR